MKPEQLYKRLVEEGGAIFSSDRCSELMIATAQADGRFAVDADGIGFLYFPQADAVNQIEADARTRKAIDVITGLSALLDIDPARAKKAAQKMIFTPTS